MADIALALHILVPSAEYSGSLAGGRKLDYDRIRWHDSRPKPSWGEIVAAQAQAKEFTDRQHGLDSTKPDMEFIAEDILHVLLANGTIGASDLDPGVVGILASRRALRGK